MLNCWTIYDSDVILVYEAESVSLLVVTSVFTQKFLTWYTVSKETRQHMSMLFGFSCECDVDYWFLTYYLSSHLIIVYLNFSSCFLFLYLVKVWIKVFLEAESLSRSSLFIMHLYIQNTKLSDEFGNKDKRCNDSASKWVHLDGSSQFFFFDTELLVRGDYRKRMERRKYGS